MKKISVWVGSVIILVAIFTGCSSKALDKTLTLSSPSTKSAVVPRPQTTANENPDPIRRYLVWDSRTMQMHFFDGADSVWIDGDWHDKGTFGPRFVATFYGTKKDPQKPVISVLNLNMPSSSSSLVNPVFVCPFNIGHIAISSIAQSGQAKWMLLHFESTSGVKGTFNLQTHQWTFTSTKGNSAFVHIDPIQPLEVRNQQADFSGATSAWIDGDWHTSSGGFGTRYVAAYIGTKSNPNVPYMRVVYMNRGPRNGYFGHLEALIETFPCPREIGRITISHITNDGVVVEFTSATGVRGTWNVESHEWSFH